MISRLFIQDGITAVGFIALLNKHISKQGDLNYSLSLHYISDKVVTSDIPFRNGTVF